MGICSRCGRKGHIEYGYDGLPYCSACIFYGMNRPCWRCRMYLPASELQQYEGQWMCPYCLMQARDEDRRAREGPKKERYAPAVIYSERCERCGKDLRRVYVWNGRKLCKSCLEEGKKTWGLVTGKPFSAPYRIRAGTGEKSVISRVLESIIDAILGIFGIKRRRRVSEVVVVSDVKKVAPLPEFGKPLVSRDIREGRKERGPQEEGIMKEKKKKKK